MVEITFTSGEVLEILTEQYYSNQMLIQEMGVKQIKFKDIWKD
jgi:hypothetical protein